MTGYFLAHEGSNDIAWGLIGFDGLAAYERYRAALRASAEGCANVELAQTERFILRASNGACSPWAWPTPMARCT